MTFTASRRKFWPPITPSVPPTHSLSVVLTAFETSTATKLGKRWDPIGNFSARHSFWWASKSSTNGNGQKEKDFQADFEEENNNLAQEHMARSNWTLRAKRTGNAIFLQFERFCKDCLLSEESVEKGRQLNITGSPSDSDWTRVATTVYSDLANMRTPYKFLGTDAVEPAPNFKYIDCYLWLRTQHHW